MTSPLPIARWNAVPGMIAAPGRPLALGVCAHHIEGIDRVEYALDGATLTAVRTPSVNPRTGAREYILEVPSFDGGLYDLTAVAFAADGSARSLGALPVLFRGDTATPNVTVFVSLSAGASDDNPGTLLSPLATLSRAVRVCPDGGDIVLLDAGRYEPPDSNVGHEYRDNARWITVRPLPSLPAGACVIAGEGTDADGSPNRPIFRANCRRLRLLGLTLDFARMSQVYELRGRVWADACRWTDRDGYFAGRGNNIPFRVDRGWFATGSLAEHCPSAFAGASMVSNCAARRVSGDVFQNTGIVVNCAVDGVDGEVNSHHSDLFQFWGARENTLAQQVRARGLKATQAFFIEPTLEQHAAVSTMRDSAFVDVTAITERVFAWNANEQREDDRGTPPFSQVYGHCEHLLFDRVKLPHQRLGFREGNGNIQAYTGDGVLLRDCLLHEATMAAPTPVGAERVGCRAWIPGDQDYDGDVDFADLNAALAKGFRETNEALSNFGRTHE